MKIHRQALTLNNASLRTENPLRRALYLAILAIIHAPALLANPQGFNAVSGKVTFDNTSTPGTAIITNNSDKAIIQWQNFNIAQGEITRFNQLNSQSAVLNRIMGGNPSEIFGQLISNGKVFLINPNGVVFGADATVDTQGLVASSLNLSNDDFLSGNYHFVAGLNAGGISNEGLIKTGKDGNIILIAPTIENNASGIIRTEGGQITLAAGQNLTITRLDEPDIRFQIQAPANTALNLGKLLADGGAINVFASSITHSGEINADSVVVDAQGNVQLVAELSVELDNTSKISANGGAGDAGAITIESKSGVVAASGALTANAVEIGKGGDITLLGEQIGVLASARIDASGIDGGGQVIVGGDNPAQSTALHSAKATYIDADATINANATGNGKGGAVRVWAENATIAYGDINAKGGQQGGDGGKITTAGHFIETSDANIDASAKLGLGGEWRLDADSITVLADRAQVNVGNITDITSLPLLGNASARSVQAALNKGMSVSVNTDVADTGSNGNITVAAAITKNAGDSASLTLNARNNVVLATPIRSTAGPLALTVTADSDASNGGNARINGALSLNGGLVTVAGTGIFTKTSALSDLSIAIPEFASVEFNGKSGNVANATIANNAQLTVNAPLTIDKLNLDNGLLTGVGAVQVALAFNFNAGTLAGGGALTTGAGSATRLASSGQAKLNKTWNNFGAIDWPSSGDLLSDNNAGQLNNRADGTITISGVNGYHTIWPEFNNQGRVNLANSDLNIFGAGADTGRYSATGGSKLYFYDSIRNFNSGAVIDSDGEVGFRSGNAVFKPGASYTATNTFIDDAIVTFDTGSAINLPYLEINGGNAQWLGGDDLEVSKRLSFYAGFIGGDGKLTTPQTAGALLSDGTALLYRDWDNYGAVTIEALAVAPPATIATTAEAPALTARNAQASLPAIELTPKQWNNYGAIRWQGVSVAGNDQTGAISLTNKPGAVYNIVNDDPSGVRELNLGAFDNQGEVNLSGGRLNVNSPGRDTGSYNVTGSGRLYFADGERQFAGADIASANPINFTGGSYLFSGDTALTAPAVRIDGAEVSFSSAMTLAALELTDGALYVNDALTVNGPTIWSGGGLSGPGVLNFEQGFDYTAGRLFASGTLIVNDTSGALSLPAMPAIGSVTARSSGALKLNGDITASDGGTAIKLVAAGQLDNSANAELAAPHGRWLVYADSPGATPSGLSADFKHYGCNEASCRDGFDTFAQSGNGLLYGVSPVLTVTPDRVTSVYGDAATVTATISGFVDGDTVGSAAIAGTAEYANNATLSNAGRYNVGHYDLTYKGGFSNRLGYRFNDNAHSVDEWQITPRQLDVAATALSKVYGAADPDLSYRQTGLLTGDTLTGALTRAAGENVGRYAIESGSLSAGDNYRIAYTSAMLAITPRDLLIAANAARKELGDRDPPLTYRFDPRQLVNDDRITGRLSRDPGENAGDYAITQGSVTAGANYAIDYVPALLTIKANAPDEPVQQQIVRQQNEVLVMTESSGKFSLNPTVKADDDFDGDAKIKVASKRLKQCR